MKPPGPFLLVVPEPGDEDPELERHLAAARELGGPDAQSRARVARALNAALPPSAPLPAFGSGGLQQAARGAGLARLTGPWLALGAALIGGAGFALGLAVGRTDSVVASSVVVAPPSVASGAEAEARESSPASAASALALSSRGVPPSSASDGSAAADAVSSAPAEPADVALAAAARGRRAPEHGARARRAPVASHGARLEAPAAPPALGFQEALDRLRRAREQLERGEGTLSLLLLSELDRSAGELLLEEREATRVLALCETGQTQAAIAAAERLERRSPRSIYARRLASSCIGDAPVAPEASDGASGAR